MFSLMGNCMSACRRQRQPKKPLTLALLGVDNAGKTTAACGFAGAAIDHDVAPTIGFRNVKFTFEGYDITLYDIGGGKSIRPVWKNYFPEVYGVIYMVDASSSDRMEEARETFRESLEHPHVSGKPILLLANKQDKPDALDEIDICETLHLESVVNFNKCPCRIDPCSAIKGSGRKMDKRMKDGLHWLITTIESDWEELKSRVDSDMKKADEQRRIEAEARKERVRKQREEREKQEEEERLRLGIEKKKDDDEDDIIVGDPFKPLNLDELKKKEERLKAEKKRRKELEASLRAQEALPGPPLRSSQLGNGKYVADGDVIGTRARPAVLPPLEPLGTLVDEDSAKGKKKKKKKKILQGTKEAPDAEIRPSKSKTIDDDDDIVVGAPASPVARPDSSYGKSTMTISNIQFATDDDFTSHKKLDLGITHVMPQDDETGDSGSTPRTPRKLKKRKLRQLGAKLNRQVGMVNEEIENSARPSVQLKSLDGGDIEPLAGSDRMDFRKKIYPLHRNGRGLGHVEDTFENAPLRVLSREPVGAEPVKKRVTKASRHSQLHGNLSTEPDHLGSRTWGMAEDLPAVADDAVAHRQPNFNSDDEALL